MEAIRAAPLYIALLNAEKFATIEISHTRGINKAKELAKSNETIGR